MKKTRKTKRIKQINLPMKFNPGLSKFEPELPVRKAKGRLKENKLKTKRNWWAFWYIILLIIMKIQSYLSKKENVI